MLTSGAEVPRGTRARREEVGLHRLDVKRITCSGLPKGVHCQVREKRLELRGSQRGHRSAEAARKV